MIISDQVQQLGLFLSGQATLEVAHDMLQHIDMLTHRRLHSQGFHEVRSVRQRQLFEAIPLRLTDQTPHRFVVLLAMGQQQVFVNCVEAYQSLFRDSVLQQILEPAVTEHPLDEVL